MKGLAIWPFWKLFTDRPFLPLRNVILAILYPDICWHKTKKIKVRFWLNINGRGYNKCKLVRIRNIHRTCLKLIKFRSSDRDFLLFYIIFSRLALIYFIITVQGILLNLDESEIVLHLLRPTELWRHFLQLKYIIYFRGKNTAF